MGIRSFIFIGLVLSAISPENSWSKELFCVRASKYHAWLGSDSRRVKSETLEYDGQIMSLKQGEATATAQFKVLDKSLDVQLVKSRNFFTEKENSNAIWSINEIEDNAYWNQDMPEKIQKNFTHTVLITTHRTGLMAINAEFYLCKGR